MSDRSIRQYRVVLVFAAGMILLSIFLTLSRGLIFDVLIFAIIIFGIAIGRSGFMVVTAFRLLGFLGALFLLYFTAYFILLWVLRALQS